MKRGFTLAELLIALVILGVIATFAIPKILVANQNTKSTAKAKEAISALAEAYHIHKANGLLTVNDDSRVFVGNYFNYIQKSTATDIADVNCSATRHCYLLASGAVVSAAGGTFSQPLNNYAVTLQIDPDGVGGETSQLDVLLYWNGRVTTRGNMEVPSCDSTGCPIWGGGTDPAWFTWQP